MISPIAGLRQAVRLAIGLLCLVPLLPAHAVAQPAPRTAVSEVSAEGTSFRIVTADGTVLRSPDLVGAVLGIDQGGELLRLRIDAVERDPNDRTGGVWLHSFSAEQPDGRFTSFCEPAASDGRAQGFPLAGRLDDAGMLSPPDGNAFQIVCTDGAPGKCVRLGFHPWKAVSDAGSLLPLFNACVRMIRADYSGTGNATTRDGATIDIYDRWGVVAAEADPDFEFEAGWDDRGAVCVRHPRIAENVTLAQLEATVPRLRGRTGPICTRTFAEGLGATVFNGSRP